MAYQIEISPTAVTDIEGIFLFYKKEFRILFTVNEAGEQQEGIVRIHRVRRASQQRLQSREQLLGDEPET